MTYVVVADFFYPDLVGGTWNYAHDLAQRLAGRGHRCFAIGGHPGDARPYRERVGAVEYYRYPLRRANHLTSFASRVIGSFRAFREIARQAPVEVLHTHGPMGAMGACLAAGLHGQPRRVATLHGTGVLTEYLCEVREAETGRLPIFYCAAINSVERWYVRGTGRLLAHSRFSRDAFADRHRLDPARVTVLPPGVDLARFCTGPKDAARDRLELPPTRPVLLSVRRLSRRMGLDRLIEAMRIVADRRPEVLLLIGGEGSWGPKLARMVAELKLEENVRLLGFVPDALLPLYYQAADLFVLPTIASEGFGLITLEALACNLPVLGTPVGATSELLDPIDPTMLFADTTPEAMAARITEWLSRLRDAAGEAPSYRERVAERYNWERCLDGFEAVLAGSKNGQ